MKVRHCELCHADAAVFCLSDAAFLCWICDAKVHEANFLAARHVRQSLCPNCNNLTGRRVPSVDFQSSPPICPSCSPASDEDNGTVSSGYSSDCISSTTSPAGEYCRRESSQGLGGTSRREDHLKAEGIFADWCGKLGVGVDVAGRMASKALRACSERWTVLPFRVCLAASMWLGLRLSGYKSVATWQVLKRLEEISGVTAKVILAAELKVERGLRGGKRLRRRRLKLEEGWAEC